MNKIFIVRVLRLDDGVSYNLLATDTFDKAERIKNNMNSDFIKRSLDRLAYIDFVTKIDMED